MKSLADTIADNLGLYRRRPTRRDQSGWYDWKRVPSSKVKPNERWIHVCVGHKPRPYRRERAGE